MTVKKIRVYTWLQTYAESNVVKTAFTRKAHAPLKRQALLPASSLLKQQILSFCLHLRSYLFRTLLKTISVSGNNGMHLSSCVSLGRESSSSNSTTSHSFTSTFNVLCVPSIKRKHTHKVAQLHVDTSKAYYLQERYHKERIVAGYVVEHTGNTKCHRFYERYPSPCHNGIEHPNDCLLCHVLRTSF